MDMLNIHRNHIQLSLLLLATFIDIPLTTTTSSIDQIVTLADGLFPSSTTSLAPGLVAPLILITYSRTPLTPLGPHS